MDINSTAERVDVSKRQASVAWKSYLFFSACAILYLLPFMRVIFVARDEGTFLCGAMRILQGQVFARDFFEVMGPGSFYILAAFFKVFGVTFLASRIYLSITSLGTALAMYFLTREVCTRYQTLPVLILAATYFGGSWPNINHNVDSNLFALLGVVCLVLWNKKPSSTLLITAGSLAGITTSIYQPKGMLLFCAFLVWLWLQRRKTSAIWFDLGLLAGGYFAIVVLVLAYFWSQGALGSLVYADFIFPRQNYGAINTVVYAKDIFHFYWEPWVDKSGPKWMVGIASILILPFLFIAALPFIVLVLGVRYKWNTVSPEIMLYWLAGWALWFSEFHRKDIFHLVCGSPLLIILCLTVLTENRKKLADIVLQILILGAACLAGSNFCMMLVAGAHITETRVGNVAVLGAEPILKFLNEHTSPGEMILVYPYIPALYFLSMTTNPIRYSFLTHNFNTPAQFQEVIDVLERHRVKYVVWDVAAQPRLDDLFPGSRPISSGDLILENYLQSHYNRVKDESGILIMKRKVEDIAK